MTALLTAFGHLPWFGMFLAVWLIGCTMGVLRTIIVRLIRAIVVALRGWPPPHLDANGDWCPQPKEGEE